MVVMMESVCLWRGSSRTVLHKAVCMGESVWVWVCRCGCVGVGVWLCRCGCSSVN